MDKVLVSVAEIAAKFNIEKVILFGSRARGDNSSVSDYDIAIYGSGLSANEKAAFSLEIEDIETLKKFDIMFIDGSVSPELIKNVMNDGVIIYE